MTIVGTMQWFRNIDCGEVRLIEVLQLITKYAFIFPAITPSDEGTPQSPFIEGVRGDDIEAPRSDFRSIAALLCNQGVVRVDDIVLPLNAHGVTGAAAPETDVTRRASQEGGHVFDVGSDCRCE